LPSRNGEHKALAFCSTDATSCAPMRYSLDAPRSGDFCMRDRDAMADNERAARIEHENKLIRRLRFLVELTFATIAQDDSMTLEQAWDHVHALKAAAVAMFPGKDDTFDLLYLPRFSRLLAERFCAN
jgi:hypothetical protein